MSTQLPVYLNKVIPSHILSSTAPRLVQRSEDLLAMRVGMSYAAMAPTHVHMLVLYFFSHLGVGHGTNVVLQVLQQAA